MNEMKPKNRFGGINQLPVEIILLIFQHTVDIESAEMKKSFPSYPFAYSITIPCSIRLSLVCKYWKEIVYDTVSSPLSLWSTLWLDFRKPWDAVETDVDRVVSFALLYNTSTNFAPLDLFMSHLDAAFTPPASSDPTRETLDGLPGLDEFIQTLFFNLRRTHILRSLSLHCSYTIRYIPIGIWDLTPFPNLRYFHFEWRGRNYPLSLRPDNFIRVMPQLQELRLTCWESPYPVEERWHQEPSLPNLRRLELLALDDSSSSNFAALLRQAPNIEHLQLRGKIAISSHNYNPSVDHVIHLPRLRKIHIHDRRYLPYPFVMGWLETPALSELMVECTNRPKWNTIWKWRQFFRRNPAIKKLSLPVKPGYTSFLAEATSVEELTLDATRATGEGWLRRLAVVEIKSFVSEEKLPVCPNLRTLSIAFGSTLPSESTFEAFLHSRFVPVDTKRNTMTGYKALERLILRFPAKISSIMDPSVTGSVFEGMGNGAEGGVEEEKAAWSCAYVG